MGFGCGGVAEAMKAAKRWRPSKFYNKNFNKCPIKETANFEFYLLNKEKGKGSGDNGAVGQRQEQIVDQFPSADHLRTLIKHHQLVDPQQQQILKQQ